MADRPEEDGGHETGRLAATRRAATLALLAEAAWPAVFGLLCLAALFLSAVWFGLLDRMGDVPRLGLVALFVLAVLTVLWTARGIRPPGREAVEARIERSSQLRHRPLRTQSDRTAGRDDAFALALWREHQRRMAARLGSVVSGGLRTQTERLDPYALRAVVALLFATAFAYSLGSGGGRVADALTAPATRTTVAARVDAWVTPPGYTGRPPLYLANLADASAPVEVPAGSVLSVRVSNGSDAVLTFTPDGKAAQPVSPVAPKDGPANASEPAASGKPPNGGSFEFPLQGSGRAELATAFRALGSWRFQVTPDEPPAIAFAGEPLRGRSGALELAFKVSDDYGAGQGKGEIQLRDKLSPLARPLVPLPEVKLSMPRRTKGEASGRTSSDLTENPYAGSTVTVTLAATDDAGQSGRSETKTIVLPERRFRNPLALAVIEQRRLLALDANAAPRVAEMIEAITLRGEDYGVSAANQIALQAARSRIANAAGDEEKLVSAVDFLWRIALGIEDGNLSDAEKRLKDAQQALSEALKNGATDEEIDKLMAELRQAMQDYMQQLAEEMKSRPPLSQEQLQSGNMQEIRPQDLQKMMDRIEDLAKSGSKDAAQQLLAEMQEMMESLQAARPMRGQQQGGEQSQMQQQMDKLGELLRKQQALKDQTFDLGRRQAQGQDGEMGEQGQEGQSGQQPMSPEDLQQQLQELQKQQGQLGKDLQQLQEAMKGMGIEPGEGFGDAGKAMGQAEDSLGQGNDGDAVGRQGEAMEALRRGARDMMRQMQEAMGQQPGQGESRQGQMNGGYGRGEQRSDRDPLGRPRMTEGPDFGQDVQVPDEIDTQRARRILDAIRKRLGDRMSPETERDYLERLLKTP